MLLTDTVGFIRKLPTQLVAAFRATLEGVQEADLLVHVADASHPQVLAQVETVRQVLAELGVADKPSLLVWNKSDALRPSGAERRSGAEPNGAAARLGRPKAWR